MIEAAASIGIAKPMPCAVEAVAELMPMTWPRPSRSGPPLLPSLMAASVWRSPVRVRVWRVAWSPTVTERPVADRMPLVTESVNCPSGLPMAIDELADLEVGGAADRDRGEARSRRS